MELNHRFLDVNQASFPLDHGTLVLKLLKLESNQRPPGSEPGVTTNSNYPASYRSIGHTYHHAVRYKLRG